MKATTPPQTSNGESAEITGSRFSAQGSIPAARSIATRCW